MIFYNHKQEFIGIDDEGLKLLNYQSLEDLLGVCGDVADLFAKEPGYIHNFKSFGWIDFLLHADSDARSAIVHGNGRTFSCTLEVHQLYMCENPSQNGFMIEMSHIQSISGDDIKPHIITPAKSVKEAAAPVEPFTPPIIEDSPSILPDYGHIEPMTLSEPDILDVPDYLDTGLDVYSESVDDYRIPAASITIPEEEPAEPIFKTPEPLQPIAKPDTAKSPARYSDAEKEFIDNLHVDKSYRFDPNVAANELGLPVDLIQEFIGDFIQQSYDFKSELFEAVLKADMNNLKILSHKLKGVAANLRIEDAFETLTTVNNSNDPIEIEANLKYFYDIIEKLEGKEPASTDDDSLILEPKVFKEPAETKVEAVSLSDDIYEFAFKDDSEVSSGSTAAEDRLSETDDELYAFPEITEESVELSEDLVEDSPVTPAKLHYDKSAVAGSLGIEAGFLDELVEDYKHDALIAGKQITESVAAFDTHAWRKTATQLKGISDHLRMIEISDELAILSETNDAQEAHKASKRLNGFLEQL